MSGKNLMYHGDSPPVSIQENVNETRNAVNDVRKTVNLSSKTAVNHIRK